MGSKYCHIQSKISQNKKRNAVGRYCKYRSEVVWANGVGLSQFLSGPTKEKLTIIINALC